MIWCSVFSELVCGLPKVCNGLTFVNVQEETQFGFTDCTECADKNKECHGAQKASTSHGEMAMTIHAWAEKEDHAHGMQMY